MGRIFKLADKGAGPETRLIVCPESAIQEDVWENELKGSTSFQYIQTFLAKHPSSSIIIGASTFYRFRETDSLPYSARYSRTMNFWYDAYNTAIFTDTSGRYHLYHKSKLVVGVEKMPFPKYLKWLDNYAIDLGGTIGTLGTSNVRSAFPILWDSVKVGTTICYESVYGEFVTGFVKNGAQLLCIITNDGWWGDTPGHRQHLRFAVLRAIETRRSIIRSANTGISCFVNQKGEILQPTKYWEPATIKASVSLSDEMTFYVRYGDYIARFSLYASALLFLLAIGQSIRQRKNAPLT
jgi:apolipoprotein N-acyltransferase